MIANVILGPADHDAPTAFCPLQILVGWIRRTRLRESYKTYHAA